MERKISRDPAVAITAILAILAYVLRANQLAVAFDSAGIMTGKGVALFTWITVAVVVLFAIFSRSLRGRKKYASLASPSMPIMVAGCVAGFFMLVSGVIFLAAFKQQGDRLIGAGSILTGLCWAGTAWFRYNGKRVHTGLFLLPAAFFVVELICRFRFWTRDPVILDYCYDLFALICVMCAIFHLGSFSFDKGDRRLTVFFSMSGVFFCAAAMAGASWAVALGYAGTIVWLLANLWLLLRPVKQKRAEETEDVFEFPEDIEEVPEEAEEPEEIPEEVPEQEEL